MPCDTFTGLTTPTQYNGPEAFNRPIPANEQTPIRARAPHGSHPLTTPSLNPIFGQRPPAPGLLDKLVHGVRQASITAVVISLVIHALGWLIAAMVIVGGGHSNSGNGVGDAGPVEMAVVTEGELTKL